jgi:uncharacterized membrane protein
MENELLIATFGGLGAMIGWGLADFFAKITIDEVGDIASLAWGHVIGTGALIVVALYSVLVMNRALEMPDSLRSWLIMIIFGAGQAAVYLFVYKGFGKGPVGVLSPVFASFTGITSILSIIIFAEVLTGHTLLGLVTLFIGILLINLDIVALKERKLGFIKVPGFKEVAIATLMAAVWTLLWDQFVGGHDWLAYTLFMYAFMTIAILIVSLFRKIDLQNVKPKMWKFLALIGITEVAAYLAISWGYGATSHTSVVALLSGAFALPTIILARLFLKEKITGVQTLGGLVVIAGIMILSIL